MDFKASDNFVNNAVKIVKRLFIALSLFNPDRCLLSVCMEYKELENKQTSEWFDTHGLLLSAS